jgi:hypothetical protein
VISSAKNIENECSKLVRTASKTNEIGELVRGISNNLYTKILHISQNDRQSDFLVNKY